MCRGSGVSFIFQRTFYQYSMTGQIIIAYPIKDIEKLNQAGLNLKLI
jgi:hypothetical protein